MNRLKSKTNKYFIFKCFLIILISIVVLVSCNAYNPDEYRNQDYSIAKEIRTGIIVYITESEDVMLENVLQNNVSYSAMINALKHGIRGEDPYLKGMRTYGPYLDKSTNYDALWNPSRGGQHVGFDVLIDEETGMVEVKPIVLKMNTYSKEEYEGRAHRLFITPKKQIQPTIMDNQVEIESLIPEGWELLDSNAKTLVKGDLNNDNNIDYAFAIQKSESDDKTSPRELIIATGDKYKNYNIEVRAQNVLLRKDEGGTMGDPFSGISIEDDSLIISFYGGSAWRWSKEASFKFIDDGWYLTKLTSENFHATSKESTKTIRDYLTGKVTEIETDEKGKEKQTKSKIDEQELINIVDFDIRKF